MRLAPLQHGTSEHGCLRATPDVAHRTRGDWPGLSIERYLNDDLAPREFSLAADRVFLCFCEAAPRRDGAVSIDGDEVPFLHTQGRIHLATAGSTFRGWVEPTGSHDLLFVNLSPQFFRDMNPRHGAIAPRLDFQSPALWTTVRKLLREVTEPGMGSDLYVEMIGRMLALEALRTQHGHRNALLPHQGGLTPRQVRVVTSWMNDSLAEPMSLAQLSSLVGLTASHFCRAFRQSTGQPPHRWLAEQRIRRATLLLADPRHTITEVAFATGFSGSSQFSRAFRRAMGASPTGYRRSIN